MRALLYNIQFNCIKDLANSLKSSLNMRAIQLNNRALVLIEELPN